MKSSAEISKWKAAYAGQKDRAKRRGIDWHFTFEGWLEWWGDDIHRRGIGVNDLCMQRVGDVGPYAAWNVRKGIPLDNGRTRSKSIRYARSVRAAAEIHAASMSAPSIPYVEPDEAGEFDDLGFRPCATWLV